MSETASEVPAAAVEAGSLPAWTPAPDFTLPATADQTVSLHEFRGRPVVLLC